MKVITVVTPCFNEEGNVEEIYHRVKDVFKNFPDYHYQHLFIDNASTDNTIPLIKSLIEKDKRIQLIVNNRNFGHLRSSYYGLLQSQGDATVLIAADLQEPPELIASFIECWERGNLAVAGIKNQSEESKIIFTLRKIYYKSVSGLSEVPLISNFTGFGLYDRKVLEILRQLEDPYPYFRGMLPDLGIPVERVTYVQPTRKRGFSKNNFYSLYDIAMQGFTHHSKIPLRMATFVGFGLGLISLLISLIYLIRKFLFWNSFSIGVAPIMIGLFFFSAIQLFFLGILGEYVAQILTHVKKRPLVLEKERLNVSFNPE